MFNDRTVSEEVDKTICLFNWSDRFYMFYLAPSLRYWNQFQIFHNHKSYDDEKSPKEKEIFKQKWLKLMMSKCLHNFFFYFLFCLFLVKCILKSSLIKLLSFSPEMIQRVASCECNVEECFRIFYCWLRCKNVHKKKETISDPEQWCFYLRMELRERSQRAWASYSFNV